MEGSRSQGLCLVKDPDLQAQRREKIPNLFGSHAQVAQFRGNLREIH